MTEPNTDEILIKLSELLANSMATQRKQGLPGLSKAPNFSGEGDDANSFLEKYMMYGNFHSWSNVEMMQAFPLSLSGTAEIWFTTLDKSNLISFETIVNLFKERFLSPTYNWVLRQQLCQRKQGSTESVDAYSIDIRKRCQRVGIPIDEQLHYFIQGLRPDLKNHMILQQPQTLDVAENAARLRESLPTAPSFSANDVFALQQNFINQLEQRQLLAYPKTNDYGQNTGTKHDSEMVNSIRTILREEMRAISPEPWFDFNEQRNFDKGVRTTTGHIICYNCHEFGHIQRNCPLRQIDHNFDDYEQNYAPENEYEQDDFESNQNFQQNDLPVPNENPRGGFVRRTGYQNQSN